MSELEEFRRRKDEFFAHDPQSPLTPEQRSTFTGLPYFAENLGLVVEAELDTNVDRDEEIVMQTTTGGTHVYRRAGVVRFDVDETPARITLFESDLQHELFVPFRDATSGKETYGAGRYLEVEPPKDGRVVVDFNYAYSPFCCYNENWSCPSRPPRTGSRCRSGRERRTSPTAPLPRGDFLRPKWTYRAGPPSAVLIVPRSRAAGSATRPRGHPRGLAKRRGGPGRGTGSCRMPRWGNPAISLKHLDILRCQISTKQSPIATSKEQNDNSACYFAIS